MTHSLKDYVNVIIVLLIGAVVAIASGQNGLNYNGWPIILICMTISFLIHWVAFIPAYLARTEKFYDISGTIAYICVLFSASYLTKLVSGGVLNTRSILTVALVSIWALRLGFFLFIRVLKLSLIHI